MIKVLQSEDAMKIVVNDTDVYVGNNIATKKWVNVLELLGVDVQYEHGEFLDDGNTFVLNG